MTWLVTLAEWSARACLLATAAGAALWLCRLRNVHARLTVWTAVLAGALLLPLAGPMLPALLVPLPDFDRPVATTVPVEAGPLDTVAALPRPVSAPAPSRWTLAGVAAGVWCAVAAALLARLATGLALSRRLARASHPVSEGVRESADVRVPVTVGLLRPVILLPAGWRDWSPERLRAVLDHERAHARRRDPLRQALAALYCGLCWFHPLAWWLKAKLIDLAEAASDDVALLAAPDRVRYAETLLEFLAAAQHDAPAHGSAMATRRTRRRRIERVLDLTRAPEPAPSRPLTAALVAAALGLAGLAAAARPAPAQASAPPEPPPAPTPVAAESPKPIARATTLCGGDRAYRKWLDEDAAYLITAEERREYLALTEAKACSDFIQAFWLRRDPTPDSEANEFKQEHYRRIAYANRRFACDIPGWRTDRGRIYIWYGPPDEIEAHPSGERRVRPAEEGGGETATYPFEKWRYRFLEGVGADATMEFVDGEGRGNYRLVVSGDPFMRAALEGAPHTLVASADGLAVAMRADRSALIRVALDSTGPVRVYGRLIAPDARNLLVFEDEARGGPGPFTRTTPPLQVGHYRLLVVLKTGGSESRQREVSFEVR
jgi:GWxTD domain-containing protein